MEKTKKRILWVDIAKAFTILTVPAFHTMKIGSTLRTLLCSFQMPLFFILSGYTTKLATDKATFKKRLMKNYLYLFLPAFLFTVIYSIVDALKYGHNLADSFIALFSRLTNIGVHGDFPDILSGMNNAVWFFIALFIAKTIMDLINCTIKTEKNGIIFIILGIIGMFTGVYGYSLPFHFDLALVGCMFIEIGMLWRKYENVVKKYFIPIFAFSIIFWYVNILERNNLELWTRSYPLQLNSIVMAICGTFVVSSIAMMLEEAFNNAGKIQKAIINTLIYIGQSTMIILIIHASDEILFRKFWRFVDRGDKWVYISAILRTLIIMAVFCAYTIMKNILIKVKNKHALKKIKNVI